MSRLVDLQKMDVFLLRACVPLFCGNVVTAEIRWDRVVIGAMNQPLARVRDSQPHRVRLAIMVRHLSWRAVQKLHDRIVAKMQLVCTLQIDNPGQGEDPRDSGLMRGQAESQLPSGGMAHHQDLVASEIVSRGILYEEVKRTTRVGEGSGPASANIADAAVLDIRGGYSIRGERGAEMAGVVQIVAGAPESSVNVDHERQEPDRTTTRQA